MATHHLKLHPKYFAEVIAGRKPFEIRFDDRNYRVGDTVVLMEYSVENGATGRQHSRLITYLLDDFAGLIPGYVAFTLGVSMPASSEETSPEQKPFQCLGCGDPVAVRMTWCAKCELFHKSIQG